MYSENSERSSATPIFPVEKERHFASVRILNTPVLSHYSTVQYANRAPAVQPWFVICSSSDNGKFHYMCIYICMYTYVDTFVCVHQPQK